jgi:hypothetical protein
VLLLCQRRLRNATIQPVAFPAAHPTAVDVAMEVSRGKGVAW